MTDSELQEALRMRSASIERMRDDDLDAVLGVENSLYLDPWTKANFVDGLHNGDDVWVLRINSVVLVGYVVQKAVLSEAEIFKVSIDKQFQHQGFGYYLLEYLRQQALSRQIERLFLEVRMSNLAAIKLYENFGFKLVGRRKNYYSVESNLREDALLYQCDIY